MKSFLFSIVTASNCASFAQDTLQKKVERYTLHFQETTVSQYRPEFHAAYTGLHSQTTENQWATTITSSIFAGVKLWPQAQVVINPEIAGGHGLSSAYGIAAFTNGEAFRVGNPDPTIYLARGFFRQLISFTKEREWQDNTDNKIEQYIPTKYLSFTIGKVSVSDYFDDNTYSHNPRTQFFSWGLMSNGAWDYAANTRGYTPSIILEYISKKVELRYALSMMPETANGNTMDKNVAKANASVLELKYNYALRGLIGKISALVYYNTAFMGSYTAQNIVVVPDSSTPTGQKKEYTITASRQYGRSKYGAGLNFEQAITRHLGLFARASYNDGKNETWCFTEIDRALSIGASLNGSSWNRKQDVIGIAYCQSGLSNEHRNYLAAGGLGFMLGDGKLNYGPEHLFEAFYNLALWTDRIGASVAYQFIMNPGYNKDRGPISVYSIRMHFHI
ncbi:MAG: carbohydrate porin [bacterium]|nr:carbohydrate porin [bacterium]